MRARKRRDRAAHKAPAASSRRSDAGRRSARPVFAAAGSSPGPSGPSTGASAPASAAMPATASMSSATSTAAAPPPAHTSVPATVEISGLTDQWALAPAKTSPWLRIRSGFVLTVLLAFVGALVAASVAGFIVLIALAVRSAVS